ncbi:MAG: hypothetical protein D6806_11475, partial [Deltaproteobacteria bacterium]
MTVYVLAITTGVLAIVAVMLGYGMVGTRRRLEETSRRVAELEKDKERLEDKLRSRSRQLDQLGGQL